MVPVFLIVSRCYNTPLLLVLEMVQAEERTALERFKGLLAIRTVSAEGVQTGAYRCVHPGHITVKTAPSFEALCSTLDSRAAAAAVAAAAPAAARAP